MKIALVDATEPPGWAGPYREGDTVVIYTGEVTFNGGIIGTIGGLYPDGMIVGLGSLGDVWFPAGGITGLRAAR